MSEYQYYEFRAVDKPLTRNDIAALRACSSRATITATSFVNDYEWGDLKADPADWMRDYFDACVYTANWRSCRLALRLPHEAIHQAVLEQFATDGALTFERSATHWIIHWALDEGQDDDRFANEAGQGWMGSLLPLRDELLRGDLRPLYLGWLAGVGACELDDDSLEPEVPPGMSQLSAAQQALVDFLEIDLDLVAAAAVATEESGSRESGPTPARTVDELRTLAERAHDRRLEDEQKERACHEAEHRKQRDAYLRMLAADVDRHWGAIHRHAELGTASGYDAAKRAIIDIGDAYALVSDRNAFDEGMRHFVARHAKRGALIRRLVEAGLWNK